MVDQVQRVAWGEKALLADEAHATSYHYVTSKGDRGQANRLQARTTKSARRRGEHERPGSHLLRPLETDRVGAAKRRRPQQSESVLNPQLRAGLSDCQVGLNGRGFEAAISANCQPLPAAAA